ncbi:MAG: hypothetical protein JOZ72_15345 [Alphaproteobacteria bacterium]|nr:hypothetical protein [Alphaproteobacteria bacterium]
MAQIFDTWWSIIRDGLNHINPIQGLIIGLLVGWAATSIIGVVFGAFAASAIYIVIDLLKPVIFDHKTFHLPVFDTAFWHFFFALYFAFLVIIALVSIIRNVIESIRG